MSRKREIYKCYIKPDPKFQDSLVGKFINIIMKSGKKTIAEGIVYGAFDLLLLKGEEDPIVTFKKAIESIKPIVEVKSKRVGGANYQVPVEIRNNRRLALALRWLRDSSAVRPERTMREKLSCEILDASLNKGGAVKRKEDTHKMAEANKAFAHYKR